MKKFFPFLLRFLPGIGVLAAIAFPTVTNAQEKCQGWIAYCCKCTKCLVVDPLPAQGYCRHCTLLCPDCRKGLGDLNLALEKLKGKNRGLKAAYDAYEKSYAEALEKYNAARQRLYGEESGNWTLSGLNGSLGKFSAAALSVLANATGATNLLKGVSNGIQIYQTSGTGDAVVNGSGAIIDFLNSDWMMKNINNLLVQEALDKFDRALKHGVPLDKAYQDFLKNCDLFPDTPIRYKDVANAGEFAGLALDAYGYYKATDELFNDVSDIKDNKTEMDIAKKEMDKITDSIVKNVDLMVCIRETLDSLKSGGLGVNSMKLLPDYAVNIILPSIAQIQLKKYFLAPDRKFSIDFPLYDTVWQINEANLNSAVKQIAQLRDLLKIMNFKTIEKEILSSLIFWITRRWKELKPAHAIQLLQKAKKGINTLIAELERSKSLSESITANLGAAITGYEINYLSDPNFKEIPKEKIETLKKNINENTAISIDKWTTTPNEKIKGEMGRVNMDFPADAEWRLEFFAAGDDYIGNRTRNDGQNFYDLAPGSYKIELNNVRVGNVQIEKGKEIKLKFGYLNIVSKGHWELHSESKEKYYKGDNKEQKLALPVGNYLFRFEEKPRSFKYYMITIKQGASVKFELPNSYLSEF